MKLLLSKCLWPLFKNKTQRYSYIPKDKDLYINYRRHVSSLFKVPEEISELLLLLLSRFSCVQLCATPQTAAHQDPPSLGFSRQEHWSGLQFPPPMHESEK